MQPKSNKQTSSKSTKNRTKQIQNRFFTPKLTSVIRIISILKYKNQQAESY
ncbi:hypothetical protein LEP1GSC005_1070 [Leptospira santarosai str. ST188]|uniref:Uncharacterized protein n=1 Tax=Leptospira santarosai str. ZUN179 TaxID=1049985 RepID=M6VD09_9LEPT|nr:hypothetical protein LEP1GSC005_1070 [Leptospira santarosai str. ST188]EMO21474.1 hypothetical protein LEP1GSC168_4126 [Leptospira santarosai str. HAI134]EMO33484.1 hypothetical protein LEP1GSC175_1030 [Leptospira santarosai str. HAI821]EMO47413.1 hypothetical protein LEP1GSC187_0589 [Leptospira santarosai str. ZUN179]EMO86457.1 hypothetical protein LEP1GSC070_0383 [Leptospira santarosai str. AIM]